MEHEEYLRATYEQILKEIHAGGKWQRLTLFEGVVNAPHLYVVKRKDYLDYAWMDPDKEQSERLWQFSPYIEQIAGIAFLRRATLLKSLKDEIRWEKHRKESQKELYLGPSGEERIKRFRDSIKELNELLHFIQNQAHHLNRRNYKDIIPRLP